MRLLKFITAVVFVIAMALTIVAQQPATQIESIKIAVVDLPAFGDEKTGIVRLVTAFQTLEREFKPRRDEIQTLRTRGQALVKEYDTLQKSSLADRISVQRKLDEIQSLEKEIKRKEEDGQQFLVRREQELTEPVWEDINKALKAFAQQRGISIILEKGRLAENRLILVVDDKGDITRAFITEYNRRGPATSPAPAPAKP